MYRTRQQSYIEIFECLTAIRGSTKRKVIVHMANVSRIIMTIMMLLIVLYVALIEHRML